MRALIGLVLLVSTFVGGIVQAEEMNTPVLIEQHFANPEKSPQSLNDTLLTTLSFQFITSDLIPGQKMTLKLAEGIPSLDVQRNDAGKLYLVFAPGFPEELMNYSIEEIQPDYFELQLSGWNVMKYSGAQIKAQMFSGTGQSRAVQFSSPIYPLINIFAPLTLPELAGQPTNTHKMNEWFDVLFLGTQISIGTPVQIAISWKKVLSNSGTTEITPILLIPQTDYRPELAVQLENEVKTWMARYGVSTDQAALRIDFTIVKEIPDGKAVPSYKLNGLDLNFTNIAL